jgi:hypothetical protein
VPGELADSLAVMRGDGALFSPPFFCSSLHVGGLFGYVSVVCVGGN